MEKDVSIQLTKHKKKLKGLSKYDCQNCLACFGYFEYVGNKIQIQLYFYYTM